MITVKNGIFTITTANTSYVMHVKEGKYIENLHYGRRITSRHAKDSNGLTDPSDIMADKSTEEALSEKYTNPYGNSVAAMGDNWCVTLDNMCLEMSNAATGDYRTLPIVLEGPDGCVSTRFYYQDSVLYEGLYSDNDKTNMPYAHELEDFGDRPWTLELIYRDTFTDPKEKSLELRVIYTAFEDCDVITKRMVLINDTDVTYTIRDISSMMLDLQGRDYSMVTFDGLWTRERHKHVKRLESGIYEVGSVNGTSSNFHNPFFMVMKNDTTEKAGDCYGFNLIYSGNHRQRAEVSEYGKTRILSGINPFAFAYPVRPGEVFYTPEAMLTFSHEGMNGVSYNCHRFVTDHIIPPYFKNRPRPVLINNWEATYFDFNRHKLVNLAKAAADLGIELFVLDDGWFGDRSDDTKALGDWFVNERKLGGDLDSLVKEIKKEGLDFGIWIEPEMISEKSRLYEAHPDWAVTVPGREAYTGRNQMILDYTRPEVRDYIVDVICKLLGSADISYVKWDMNRPVTDAYSKGDTVPGAFYHDYVLGLYDVMKRITDAYPHVLFEGCSAGGNRFDLGILGFMPQIWTSDDTDPNERMFIQEGTSYGYPQSVMGAHVSASPNHQTLRETSLETRFNVAAMGVLGYELDLTRLSLIDRKTIKEQVAFYKEHRELLQTGSLKRVYSSENNTIWQVTDDKKEHAVALLYKRCSEPNQSYDILYADDLNEDSIYRVRVKSIKVRVKTFGNLVNQISPVYIKEDGVMQAMIGKAYALDGETEEYVVNGAVLMYAGIRLSGRFIGTGLNEGTRVMGDYSSRLYCIDKIK